MKRYRITFLNGQRLTIEGVSLEHALRQANLTRADTHWIQYWEPERKLHE